MEVGIEMKNDLLVQTLALLQKEDSLMVFLSAREAKEVSANYCRRDWIKIHLNPIIRFQIPFLSSLTNLFLTLKQWI